MKLYSILTLGCIALGSALSSCDAVYEDLDPCPKGADVTISYTKNILDTEALSKVHCANLLLYDEAGFLVGNFPYNGQSTLSLDLPAGRYHAIAYGGMECSNSHFAYSKDVNNSHSYPGLYTYIKGTRGGEVSANLHEHFHGVTDFTVPEDATSHVPAKIDLTKNTNNFRIVFQYLDGSAIDPNKFDYAITADNSTLSHDNTIIPTGTPTIYRPFDRGTYTGISLNGGGDCQNAYADISTGRLAKGLDAYLSVYVADTHDQVMNLDMIRYLNDIRGHELSKGSLQDYLDSQDRWTFIFILDPKTDHISGVVFRINKWEVNLANSDLEF